MAAAQEDIHSKCGGFRCVSLLITPNAIDTLSLKTDDSLQ